MSFFTSQLRAGLRFPIASFFCEVSRELQVPFNQLVPNSIRIFVAFSVVLQYNNLIHTFGVFSQCSQLKQTKPGVFHFTPRRGVSVLLTPSPPKQWKSDFFFVLPPTPYNIHHRWIYESLPAVQVFLVDRSFNLCGLLDKLNERPYDCRELTEERLQRHFDLRTWIVPLQEALGIFISFIIALCFLVFVVLTTSSFLVQTTSCLASISRMSTGTPPLLWLPGP
ncbi:UNVERIFIED_CONTAM: hypothetical protein Slati_3897500 [Sesamum latifolium]|uniref:Transposase (putative) gypsy type domain-containing protein n=1 Tax=Sesamum latifolium TaxID=2727402 RepID=A0AAW2TQF8_9LAMI